jgi:MFS family permease
MHPLLHLLMAQPGLLGEHAQGYAGLLASEVAELREVAQRRLLWGAATAACASIGVVLGGVALMLWAVMPVQTVGAQWVLLVTPGVPLIAALLCLQALRSPAPAAFARTKQQIQADMNLLSEFHAP